MEFCVSESIDLRLVGLSYQKNIPGKEKILFVN